MGGTSTDVALYDGALPQRFETGIAGVRLQAPMMNIHTVAAGGGSMLAYAGGRLTVGPGSAGSEPGPACYRNGGPLAVTDIQVLLGRIRADTFPAIFGASGDEPLDIGRRAARISRPSRVRWAVPRRDGVERLAAGFLDVAVESMARAIRHVSIREGHDPAEFALLCYGGAAPQHACRVADALGIREILIHPLAGVLSALGIGLADRRLVRRQSLERRAHARHCMRRSMPRSRRSPRHLRGSMVGSGRGAARHPHCAARSSCGRPARKPRSRSPHAPLADVLREFRAVFTRRFGFAPPDGARWSRRSRVEAVVAGERRRASRSRGRHERPRPPASTPGSTAGARFRSSSALRLPRAQPLAGPALVVEPNSTTVVEPGWTAERPARRHAAPGAARARGSARDRRRTRRSRAARAVQPPVHAGGGADGCRAAGDGRLGQHPRAARFLLRAVRRCGGAHRERAAHAGPPRFHGRERACGHRGECGRSSAPGAPGC